MVGIDCLASVCSRHQQFVRPDLAPQASHSVFHRIQALGCEPSEPIAAVFLAVLPWTSCEAGRPGSALAGRIPRGGAAGGPFAEAGVTPPAVNKTHADGRQECTYLRGERACLSSRGLLRASNFQVLCSHLRIGRSVVVVVAVVVVVVVDVVGSR